MIKGQEDNKGKSTLELWYIAKIQTQLYKDSFNFHEFPLDTLRLKADFLEKLNLVNDEDFFIKLKGKLSYGINKDDSEYSTLYSAINNGFIVEFIDFLRFIDEEKTIYTFGKLCLEIINYLQIKKNLNFHISEFDSVSINCVWEIDNKRGCFMGINNVWTVTEVCDIIPNYIDMNADTFVDLYNRKQEEKIQPVYHELLFEAENAIRNYSIRSGLLILYSALEVATKTFIREGKVQTDYIIRRLQSPSLTELYNNYINKEIKEVLSVKENKILMEMTEFRNAVAHRGELIIKFNGKKITVTVTRLFEYLSFVKIIIGRIDKELKYIT